MEKYKKLKLSIITLLLALVVALTAAVFVINGKSTSAFADDRLVELDGNTVFYTAIHGAEITQTKLGEGEDEHYYTTFKIGSGEEVSYRQNLAYKWITASGNEFGTPEEKNFSIKLKFPETNFKMFYIKFESQQYTLTKDGKSTNYLVFTADGENVKIGVSSTAEKDGDKITDITEIKEIGTATKNGEILIELGNYSEGNYAIKLNGEDKDGELKNVSENFASYVASGDNAVTPMTFGAIFDEENVETENGAEMVLMDVNGQSFETYEQSNGSFKIKDTAAPVLCFSQTPSYLEYGKSLSLQYKVIDVIASSPRSTAYYYVLTGEQVSTEGYDFNKTDYEEKKEGKDNEEGEGEGEDEEEQENPFIKVTTSSSERIYSDENTFIPRKYLKSDVMGLVKLYYEISDVSSTSTAKTDKVFVDWYAKYEALEEVKGAQFIKLIKNKEGVTYAKESAVNAPDPLDAYKENVGEFQELYQDKIKTAIEAMEDGKLYAGGNKFYLPSIEWDFYDDYFYGTDFKYSIYYKGATTGSHTSLASNKLAIDLNDADVTYRFTIYITDAFGNPMRYPTYDEKKDEVVWEKIETSEVWDAVDDGLLPYFEFEVSYKQATAEPPEDLSISYVKTSYSGVSFKITGVTETYTATYKLYVFDRNKYYADTHDDTLDYDAFSGKVQEIFENPETRKYFTTVKPVSELLESDENYEQFKKLNWNATSISFTPQSVEDFYVVELQLKDKRTQSSYPYYATVTSSVQANPLKGESESWVEQNKTSVILFVVAGVCLVALIVLLVIKPKDKGDIDTIYTEVESKDKGKKKSKN